MSVQTLAPAPLDDRHPDWCNPAECEPGDTFVDGGRIYGIDAIHTRTLATFDALHGGHNDTTMPVRLVREQCGTEDWHVLRVGDTAVRLTADQLAMLRGAS